MRIETEKKYRLLKEKLKELDSVAVAFSGGVDSALLLRAAHDVLGDRAAAFTARAGAFPGRERREAEEFCKKEAICQIICDFDIMSVEGFAKNPPDRCYHCKKALFETILRAAEEKGFAWVAEGSNLDDNQDYRPGHRAVAELGIASPMRDAGLTKEEIREISRELGLSTWNKPSCACLASRFVYGETITLEKLSRVEQAEQYLRDLGFGQLRVRVHGNLARIEVLPEDISRLMPGELGGAVSRRLKELGFTYVTLDLGGFHSGSMNLPLGL